MSKTKKAVDVQLYMCKKRKTLISLFGCHECSHSGYENKSVCRDFNIEIVPKDDIENE